MIVYGRVSNDPKCDIKRNKSCHREHVPAGNRRWRLRKAADEKTCQSVHHAEDSAETWTVTTTRQEISVKYSCWRATLKTTCVLLHRGEKRGKKTAFIMWDFYTRQVGKCVRLCWHLASKLRRDHVASWRGSARREERGEWRLAEDLKLWRSRGRKYTFGRSLKLHGDCSHIYSMLSWIYSWRTKTTAFCRNCFEINSELPIAGRYLIFHFFMNWI